MWPTFKPLSTSRHTKTRGWRFLSWLYVYHAALFFNSIIYSTSGYLALVSIPPSYDLLNMSILHCTPYFRILDALHLALVVHCVYYYLVTNYANFNALTEIVWSLKVSFLLWHSMQPDNAYDVDGLVQLQLIVDVCCFFWTLRFTLDMHLTGSHRSYGTSVSSMCNVTRNILIDAVWTRSSYVYRIWIGISFLVMFCFY